MIRIKSSLEISLCLYSHMQQRMVRVGSAVVKMLQIMNMFMIREHVQVMKMFRK